MGVILSQAKKLTFAGQTLRSFDLAQDRFAQGDSFLILTERIENGD